MTQETDITTIESDYSVNLWGSDPDKGNDDCYTGENFDNFAAAKATFDNPWSTFDKAYYQTSVAFIEIVAPGCTALKANPGYVAPKPDTEDDWAQEQAMQNGMAFGCAGYNDSKGY